MSGASGNSHLSNPELSCVEKAGVVMIFFEAILRVSMVETVLTLTNAEIKFCFNWKRDFTKPMLFVVCVSGPDHAHDTLPIMRMTHCQSCA
eukprot:361954-Chlamydomonas_euryale.AAC.1